MAAPTLVSTPGLATSNSYLTVAEADTYFTAHLYSTDWDGAIADTQSAALQMATRLIDRMFDWENSRVNTTQALEWPRVGMLAFNQLETIGDTVIPDQLKHATAELAQALIAGDRTADSALEVNRLRGLSAGPVSLQFDAGVTPKIIPDAVYFAIPRWWGKVVARRKMTREVKRG